MNKYEVLGVVGEGVATHILIYELDGLIYVAGAAIERERARSWRRSRTIASLQPEEPA